MGRVRRRQLLGHHCGDSYEEAMAQALHDIGTTGDNVQVAAIRWVE
jgi:hypothetical protein